MRWWTSCGRLFSVRSARHCTLNRPHSLNTWRWHCVLALLRQYPHRPTHTRHRWTSANYCSRATSTPRFSRWANVRRCQYHRKVLHCHAGCLHSLEQKAAVSCLSVLSTFRTLMQLLRCMLQMTHQWVAPVINTTSVLLPSSVLRPIHLLMWSVHWSFFKPSPF